MKVEIKINNMPESVKNPYIVLRQDNGSVWYYGAYNDKRQAESIARDIGNGFVTERVIE